MKKSKSYQPKEIGAEINNFIRLWHGGKNPALSIELLEIKHYPLWLKIMVLSILVISIIILPPFHKILVLILLVAVYELVK